MTPITWYLYGRSGGAKKAVEEIGVKESASGDIAVISDGANDVAVKSLVAEITPVQDLHGQANPYPAGGGKNLIPFPYSKQSGTYNGVTITVNDDGTLLLNGTATSTVYWDLKSGADAVSMPAGSYILHRPSTTAVTGLTITAAKNGDFWNTASQANVNLTLENDAYVSWYIRVESGTTLSNVKVYPMFEKGTTASDWSPYSNIRPISGRTGLTVTRVGKNLLPLPSTTADGWNAGYITADGGIASSSSMMEAYSDIVAVIGGESYTFSYRTSANHEQWGAVAFYDETETFISRDAFAHQDIQTLTGTKTAPSNARYVRVMLRTYGDVTQFQLEKGTAATAYEPYTAQTYPVTWESSAGTVYGGTLDVVSGVLTVDTILATVSSFVAENANWSNDSTIAVSSGSALAEPRDGAKRARAVTNMLPNAIGYGIDTAVGSQYTTTPCFGFNANDTYNRYLYARFPKTVGTTLAEVNAYLAEHPLIIAYATQTTPSTYQLTPTEVKTLLGGNTIYTDAGAVSVEYVADTKLYIDNKVAELQALILEN